ncbi:alpha/beta-hydrolase, partial [Caulochytrium protostelioides]
MLDHALGRPSPGWQRTQVLATVLGLLLWSRRRPPSRLASLIAFLTAAAWTVVLRTLAAMHALRHFALLTWMNEPESRARMYTRHYFRVTYLFNALDAGFLTAMHLRPAVLRDLASFLLTGFYLCCPVMAEHKIHAYRHSPTVQMLRVSLNKAAHPVLRFLTRAHRPRLGIRRNIVLPRPAPAPAETSFPGAQPLPAIPARLYYAGTPAELARCREVILQCPGGGFVAMNPTCHDDWTSTLAQRTGRPIVGLDYGKAPQYPFPWAIEECFDAYRTLLATRGACIGLRLPRGETLRVILLGDSAGGNLAVTTCYKAMLAADPVPMPQALLLIYPSLSFEMNCWLSPDEIALISSESAHQSGLFDLEHAKHRRREYAPLSEPPAPRGYDVKADRADTRTSWSTRWLPRCFARFRSDVRKGPDIPAALSMSSKFSYFRDRVLTPEMLRAFALLYLTKSPIPIDLEKDFLISPVLAPDALLAELPPVYMICGERDPLIDDTVLFAGRYRVVHEEAIRQRRTRERSRSMARRLHVKILPGISHGFLNMLGLLPE